MYFIMIRTRFAPSPTGYLHVGGLRTALYCYLFARKNKGQLVLRIEDTDQKRQVEGAEKNLIKTLAWSGIEFDEGPHVAGPYAPYRQSERTEIYRFHAHELIEKGKAYRCFCSEDRLEALRKQQEASKMPTGYDGYCRNLTKEELESNLKKGIPHVIRLKVPKDQFIVFSDLVRGKVKVASHTIDDQVLLKSDGFPTYHLANVVDDHLMKITHVIRGEEWLPSTPKHILLYQAFDWDMPEFAHLPLILNPDRSKLSKRQGDVAVEDYMKKGYEKEEIINFIAFLGWNPGGTREIFSLPELVETFDLLKVQKGGAIFNGEKLKWFRGVWRERRLKEFAEQQYLEIAVQETKQGGFKIAIPKTTDRLKYAEALYPFVRDHLKEHHEKDWHFLLRALYAVRDKVSTEPERVEEFLGFYWQPPKLQKSLILSERMSVDENTAKKALAATLEAFHGQPLWEEKELQQALIAVIEKTGLKIGQVMWPVRVALTHVEFSPGAFESAWVLFKEETIKRLEEALQSLS